MSLSRETRFTSRKNHYANSFIYFRRDAIGWDGNGAVTGRHLDWVHIVVSFSNVSGFFTCNFAGFFTCNLAGLRIWNLADIFAFIFVWLSSGCLWLRSAYRNFAGRGYRDRFSEPEYALAASTD